MILVNDTSLLNSLVNKKFLETIRIKDAKIYHLSYHQNRLNSCIPNSNIFLAEIIVPPNEGLYRCRVIYDNDSYKVSYHSYSKRTIKSLKLVYDDTIVYDKKYADRRELEILMKQKGECSDILVVKNGLVTDTSIANIALKQNGQWFTPSSPLLYGTTRQRLLDKGKLKIRDIKAVDLNDYSQIALMNAMIDFDIIPNKNIREIIC